MTEAVECTHVDPEAHGKDGPAEEEVVPQPNLPRAVLHHGRRVATGGCREDGREDEGGEGKEQEGKKVDQSAGMSDISWPFLD
jgi:hypothetical protein